ncbi:pectin lyase fold/virulence factor [Fimicolochytrium jonesii]|uniref:pectin lyase fold/virulence factor n=1 Tax=Fimicolochytrium jonesii TaxID=1396493 RepID=UPI0022FEF878|nr:pectin lyase fold/virulence factor [Fimicolochytrium jonesii]KAI8816893.1 pectin lyase fold/virulence factor [Fimicolochytrium jonesii]
MVVCIAVGICAALIISLIGLCTVLSHLSSSFPTLNPDCFLADLFTAELFSILSGRHKPLSVRTSTSTNTHYLAGASPALPGCQLQKYLRLFNAAKFHITVIGNHNELWNIRVEAAFLCRHFLKRTALSSESNYVHDVYVRNGDECFTVKTPTNNFRGENIFCNNTAGNNIGSFGNGPVPVRVSNVYYRNVTLIGPASAGIMHKAYIINNGYVTNVTYEDFRMESAAYPISINPFWCGKGDCGNTYGNLTFSNITYRNFKIYGKNDKPRALVQMKCISSTQSPIGKIQCSNIKLCNVDRSQAVGYGADDVTNVSGHTTNCK